MTEYIRFEDTIEHGVKVISDFGNNHLMPHFIYCSDLCFFNADKLETTFLKKMKAYGIQSSVLTRVGMQRNFLITKEKQKLLYDGKLKNDAQWNFNQYKGSINDDLESFYTNLQNLKVRNEVVWCFFTPKLNEEELKLVKEKNIEHMRSYLYDLHRADVDEEEMKKSNSKDKYVHCHCWRRTFCLRLRHREIRHRDIRHRRLRRSGKGLDNT